MKKSLLIACAALFAAGCQSFDAGRNVPDQAAYTGSLSAVSPDEWDGAAYCFFQLRDLPKARQAIADFISRQNGSLLYESTQPDQYAMRFAVPTSVYGEIEPLLLENKQLSYFSRFDYSSLRDAEAPASGLTVITVVMDRERLPGPLYLALWLPASILEKLVYLD